MAAKTYFLANAVATGSNGGQLTETAQADAVTATGWIVGTGATQHAAMDWGIEVPSANFVDTTHPDGTLDNTTGDFLRTENALTGAFAAGNWSLTFVLTAETSGGAADGRIRFRLFKGSAADGSNAVEITSAQQSCGIATDVGTKVSSALTTFNPGAFSLNNEYLFFQIAWERTGAGGMANSDVHLVTGSSSTVGTRIVTTDLGQTVQHYVNTASVGGDGTTNNTSGATAAFASLSSWEANVGAANNAGDHYIVDCCGTAADTTAVTVDFVNNITTGSITIRGNRSDAAGFYTGNQVISTGHYRLNAGDSAFTNVAEANCTVDGIQVIPTGGAFRHGIGNVAQGAVVRNCRVHTTSGTRVGIGQDVVVGHSGTTVYENNLIVNFDNGIEFEADSFRTPTVTFRHNTIYGDGAAAGIRFTAQANGGGAWTLKANAIANNGAGNDFIDGATGIGSATVTYADNALENSETTTDEIALGTPASAWTSPGTTASSDFTVKNTSSALYNAVNPTLVTTDITGFTRDGTNHDVGAFEFQAAAAAGSLPYRRNPMHAHLVR